MKKKKLLVIASTFPRWRNDVVPPFVYELSKRLTKNFAVFVLAPHSQNAKKKEIMDGMKIFRFKYWFGENLVADGAILPNLRKNKLYWIQVPFFLISELICAYKIIKKNKINLVHAHWIIPQGFMVVILKKIFFPNLKIIVTSHGGDVFGMQKLNFLKRKIINNSSSMTVVSSAIKEKIRRLKIRKDLPIHIISMGIDTTLFNSDKKDNLIRKKYEIKGLFILFVGRLSEKKGVKYLIQAMPYILKKKPEAKLIILGDGENRKELKRQVDQKKLNDSVKFLGFVPNNMTNKFFATADIFVGPSIIAPGGDTEGFGLVFVEAMASGCVTIASDLPAIHDIITHKKTGFFVPMKKPYAIAKIIININFKTVRKIKNNAIKKAKEFDWKIISQKYKEVLI